MTLDIVTPPHESSAPPPTTSPPAAPVPGSPLPAGSVAAVAAVLALILAAVALVFRGDTTSTDGGDAVSVGLTEFAITPAVLQVPTGGSLRVTNNGTAAHNLSVQGTDIVTSDLAAGASEDLDLSSLAAGDYQVICTIPGHADSGMTATLTVGSGTGSGGSGGAAAPAGGHGDHMTSADYERMDKAMEETIAAYPAKTEGVGNQLLEPKVRPGGVKEFELTAAITPWEVEPGKVVDAWTYNGMVPGPTMRVDVGDKVRIILHNKLPMGTDLHLHGVNIPNAMDGVAPVTQKLVAPGESFTYEFVADEVAVAMYHAHHHAQLQVPNGMLGTFFVGKLPMPAGRTISGEAIPANLRVAQELPLVLNDTGVIGYSLNGKSFPATAPIVAKQGDWVLLHYFNEGGQIHPMHLHQFDQVVVAKDGFPLDQPYVVDTLNVAPGERYSVLVKLDAKGTWVWHCHILNHVERDTGMFGMVTAIVVE